MALRIKFHSLSVVLALARLAQAPCLGESCAVGTERFMVDVGMHPTKVSVSCKGHEFPTFAACCCALTIDGKNPNGAKETLQTSNTNHYVWIQSLQEL